MRERASWRERTYDATLAAELAAAGLSPVLARLLAIRGIAAAELEAFFSPTLKQLLPPDSLPGIAEAVRVIVPFVRDRRKIVVFGDYDADGVCASAILVSVLRRLGAVADAFIPERVGEGYGMTTASLTRLHAEHPDVALVVTVDNGITSADEVRQLKEKGIAVVVTDHHLPPAADSDGTSALPEADALVDPRVASGPGCEDLCGAGVAFFLANALTAALREEAVEKGHLAPNARLAGPLVVMAGLATVADLMALKGPNRILVTSALAEFRRSAPLGLRELVDKAARRADDLVARDFAFLLAPRLNAAGRMASARLSYELLMTADREEARLLAVKVDGHNAARKTEEQRMDAEARLQAGSFDNLSALVVAESRRPADSPPWHPGVAGIVASRLLEDAHVPVAVVVGDHGSVRAPEGYNVRAALDAAAATLERYGGHAAAGGFTVKPGQLDEFQRLFSEACAACRATAPDAAAIPFDGWLEPSDLTMEFYSDILRLEPFGEGHPEPVFGLKGVFFSDARPVGQDGRHAAFSFAGRGVPRAVWWGHGADAEIIRAHAATRYDVLFTLATSSYGSDASQPHLELRLVDVRPAL